MDTAIDLSDASKALDLANIRFQLIRLEDTIVFHLIERVQFPLNKTIYEPGGIKIPNSSISLFDWMLREQERIHSLVRRYQSPDEHPFFPDALETPILQPLNYPQILHPNTVNVNEDIKQRYIETVLPLACRKFEREDRGETQENYGSAATCDVACLQALSRRIHFGKFVAESKFRAETDRFVKLIRKEDREGIDKAITNAAVEAKVLERLRLKAKTYGTDPSIGVEGQEKINVDAVVTMYKETVIPLTKIVEVEYLMQRLIGTKWRS
ncbi:chorismate mutase aro7 [Ptychographa xylographoides]|nr:chorismate mutase aro7 [Ptychographa xylographoides]